MCYNGQKKFSKNEFGSIKLLLDSFDKNRIMKMTEVDHIERREIPITHKYSKLQDAKNAAPKDCKWMAEYYVTKSGTNRGRKSSCRNCKTEIKKNTLCIRVDVGGTKPVTEKNTKQRQHAPTILTFRYCPNQNCFTKINALDKRISHIQPMENLYKGNLKPSMIEEMSNMLGNIEILSEN